jgi:hypothetical protein
MILAGEAPLQHPDQTIDVVNFGSDDEHAPRPGVDV